jgi:phosphatidylcholine synthase
MTQVDQPDSLAGSLRRAAAFSVHVFTALGAGVALLALLEAVREHWAAMFVWLGVALMIDGVDGPVARRLDVARLQPNWSGDVLDLVVDFVTYVFVPAYAIAAAGLLPDMLAVPLGILIVTTSALYFADRQMKTEDNGFRGFPAVWNAIAFYLFLLRPNPWIGAAVIVALAVLTFAPVHFIHPFRVVRLRALSIAMLALWTVLGLIALARDLAPGPWVTAGLCVIALYFLAAGMAVRLVPRFRSS